MLTARLVEACGLRVGGALVVKGEEDCDGVLEKADLLVNMLGSGEALKGSLYWSPVEEEERPASSGFLFERRRFRKDMVASKKMP